MWKLWLLAIPGASHAPTSIWRRDGKRPQLLTISETHTPTIKTVSIGASYFLTKQVHVGPVGYFYQQITDDRGAPAFLDGNRSRIIAVGPQIGLIIAMTGIECKGLRRI
jgi:hypothetical protein